tara:strand:- start:14 stop:589 length:576 start_codon:yes stop_codon:yes gene_type:complete
MIHEVIVTTINKDKKVHIAPMGVKILQSDSKKLVQISPFKPSQTLNNILETKIATVNFIDNVKVFSGIVTGEKKDWGLEVFDDKCAPHLQNTNTHMNVKAIENHDDPVRPRIICEVINEQIHRPFLGFNRAQFSVIELAVLSTRLGRINDNKIKDEMKYLKIGIDKTAGKNEKEAWEWIEKKINIYFENND